MIVIRARNVNDALPQAVRLLVERGIERASRNGPVLLAPEPVTIVYEHPEERVLFWPERDANPFFHLCEALWMIAGRDDVEFPAFFVPRMRQFSDDGVRFHAPYGHRWRRAFGQDQLPKIISALRANPDCRRQVLQFWSAELDLGHEGKDLPCNTVATFQIDNEGRLETTVFQRSGDLVLGVTGANAVHLSVLAEYIANAIGAPLGAYRQVVVNLHAYLDTFEPVRSLAEHAGEALEYPAPPYPLGAEDAALFDEEAALFCDWAPAGFFLLPFFIEVAVPLRDAYRAYKECPKPEAFEAARELLDDAADCDWRLAAEQWIDRREERWKLKQEGKETER